jgi:hypothetical protein
MMEKHGIGDAVQAAPGPCLGDQSVIVTDGKDFVKIWFSTAERAAAMTPEQARFIAKCLMDSARRVEQAAKG